MPSFEKIESRLKSRDESASEAGVDAKLEGAAFTSRGMCMTVAKMARSRASLEKM